MEIKLDDSFDTHWIYVNRFQKTSFNIIVRARIDRIITKNDCLQASKKLAKEYPYLSYHIKEKRANNQSSEFFLVDEGQNNLNHKVSSSDQASLDKLMTSPSKYLNHRLDIENGEQLLIHFWVSKEETVIELVCAHLIGDMSSILTILKSLLGHIENKFPAQDIAAKKRLSFDEIRYGWAKVKPMVQAIPLPPPSETEDINWPKPELSYGRFQLPLATFKKIDQLMKKDGNNSSAIDCFYFIAQDIYQRLSKKTLALSTVNSFRHLLPTDDDKRNTNTSAVFCPINIEASEKKGRLRWTEEFKQQRKDSLKIESILGLMGFLRSLNASMHSCSESEGKSLLKQLLPINAFAFNNFGNIDSYLNTTVKVTDVDIQDAAPAQEVRIYSLNGMVNIAPLLYKNTEISPDIFWEEFHMYLNNMLNEK